MVGEAPRSGFRGQEGRGSLAVPLLLLLLLAVGYTAYKFGPPLLSHYQLRGTAQKIAGYSASGVLGSTRYSPGASQGTVEDVTRAILMEARELRIPLERKNVQVTSEKGQVSISVDYSVPIRLAGGMLYSLDLGFQETN